MPKAKKAPDPVIEEKPIDPNLEILDVEQNSPEWYAARIGICTASNLGKIMAKGEGKTRLALLRQIAGEISSGKPAETFKSAAMERGNVMEPEIREKYAEQTFDEIKLVGFAKRKLARVTVGASPDSLVGEDGGVEFKSMNPAGMIEIIQNGCRPPTEHRAQIQGNMLVFGRKWWDLVIGYSGMPLLKWRFQREEAYIAEIIREVELFDLDVRNIKKMVDALR